MSAKKEIQTINWTMLGVLALAGLVSAGRALGGLKNMTLEEETQGQTSYEIQWEQPEIMFAVVLGGITLLLLFFWKRLFPYNVPCAMVVGGAWYAFLFQVTTVGWARLIGFMGFFIAVAVGLVMMMIYAFGARKWGLRNRG
ncbi:hypothetical protein LCL96_14255 [Rossellomorea aquimaris]|uniref:hypothetical protein n=1 Tax=Rossellomorea TaxID=2837508 RepID=UPI001CD1FCC1|nr:hypothetical protein [Rossellomorea aquimaris]MCA1060097.1 hypothetical protein [Rossellomorea aquimaris]